MTEKALLYRLPKDVVVDFAGCMSKPPRLYIGMTLSTVDHVEALRQSLDIFQKLLEIGGCSPETTSQNTSQTTTEAATEAPTAITAPMGGAASTAVSASDGMAETANTGIPSKPEIGTN